MAAKRALAATVDVKDDTRDVMLCSGTLQTLVEALDGIAPIGRDSLFSVGLIAIKTHLAEISGKAILTVIVPIGSVSEANRRGEHWTHFRKRNNEQRFLTAVIMRSKLLKPPLPTVSVAVVMERIANGHRMDTDGLSTALKHYRDGAADWLKREKHDADVNTHWFYRQSSGKTPMVRVSVFEIGQ